MPDLPKRILLVEDEPALREILRLLFADEADYELVEATSIDGAVAALSGQPFQLILADGFSSTPVGVPGATAPLREAAGKTPVVLLTAHAIPVDEALAVGFAAVISKPFDLEALLAQVRALLAM